MSQISSSADRNLLFGFGAGDDTGVYKISDDIAIVQSVDFFTPIVDDPYQFGQIAAANAFSDLYTVGAKPLTALNIVAFPCGLGMEMLAVIMKGGADMAAEAGAAILGGHSVDDDEPKYGMAVTGVVHPGKMITNRGALPGDALILTKKLGTGIIANMRKNDGALSGALKAGGVITDDVYEEALLSMTRLNKSASGLMAEYGVRACTDVTGFGLVGHAGAIAEASGVSLAICYSLVPRFDGVESAAIKGTKGGGERNQRWMKERVALSGGVTLNQLMVLCDAQTSGGLLMVAPKENSAGLVEKLKSVGDSPAAVIGHVEAGEPGTITIKP